MTYPLPTAIKDASLLSWLGGLAATASLFLFVWYQFDLLLLTFAGILLAIWLRELTGWIEQGTSLSALLSYVAALALLGGGAVLAGWLVVPSAISHLSRMASTLPASVHRIEEPLLRRPWSSHLISRVGELAHSAEQKLDLRQVATHAGEAAVDAGIVLIIGFFASLNPRGYRAGLLALVPDHHRERIDGILRELQHQLRRWIFGQMFIMAVLGVTCGIILWLLHVPMAGTLGLLTGIAVFLPYVGSILAGVPSVLMGLQRGPETAICVLITYTALHVLEGYFLTPLVQRRAIRLPPVVTVLAQFFLWNVAGTIGVIVAAPLATAAITLTKLLYLRVPADKPIVVKR